MLSLAKANGTISIPTPYLASSDMGTMIASEKTAMLSTEVMAKYAETLAVPTAQQMLLQQTKSHMSSFNSNYQTRNNLPESRVSNEHISDKSSVLFNALKESQQTKHTIPNSIDYSMPNLHTFPSFQQLPVATSQEVEKVQHMLLESMHLDHQRPYNDLASFETRKQPKLLNQARSAENLRRLVKKRTTPLQNVKSRYMQIHDKKQQQQLQPGLVNRNDQTRFAESTVKQKVRSPLNVQTVGADKVIDDNNRDLNDFKRAIKNLDQLDSKRASSRKKYPQHQENSFGNFITNSVLGISSFGADDSGTVNEYPQNRHREQIIKNFYRIAPKKPKSVGKNNTARVRKGQSKPGGQRRQMPQISKKQADSLEALPRRPSTDKTVAQNFAKQFAQQAQVLKQKSMQGRGSANYASARGTGVLSLIGVKKTHVNDNMRRDGSLELNQGSFYEQKRLVADSPAQFVTDKSIKREGGAFTTMQKLNLNNLKSSQQ